MYLCQAERKRGNISLFSFFVFDYTQFSVLFFPHLAFAQFNFSCWYEAFHMTWNQKCSEFIVYYVRIFTQAPPLVLCALPSNVLCALVHNERLCCVNISPYWRACCVLCALPSRQPQSYCCDQHLASNHPTTQPHKRPNQQPPTNQQALQRPVGLQGFLNFGELHKLQTPVLQIVNMMEMMSTIMITIIILRISPVVQIYPSCG